MRIMSTRETCFIFPKVSFGIQQKYEGAGRMRPGQILPPPPYPLPAPLYNFFIS